MFPLKELKKAKHYKDIIIDICKPSRIEYKMKIIKEVK